MSTRSTSSWPQPCSSHTSRFPQVGASRSSATRADPGILAADACAGAGLEVPELSEPSQDALRALVARDATVRNPIDLVAGATAEQFEQALRVALQDDGIDALLAIFVPPLVTRAQDVARAIASASEVAGDKPVVACFLGKAGVPRGAAW